MKRFISLEAYNFVTHKHSYLELAAGQSLFIGGYNLDAVGISSNGSGKSLLYDAIRWCLYGVTIRGFKADEVIGVFDKHAYVKTTWEDEDGKIIEVVRYRKHKKYSNDVKVFVDGTNIDKTKNYTPSGTNAHIVKLFQMSSEAFVYSSVFSKTRSSICEKKPAERITLLSQIIDLPADEGLKSAKKTKKDLSERIHRLDMKLSSSTTVTSESKKRLDDLKKMLDNFREVNEQEKERVEEETADKVKKLKRLKTKRDKLEIRIDEMLDGLIANRQAQELIDKKEAKSNKLKVRRGKAIVKLETRLAEYRVSEQAVIKCKIQSGADCPVCKQYISPGHIRKLVFELKKDRSHKREAKKRALLSERNIYHQILEIDSLVEELENSIDTKLDNEYSKLKSNLSDIKREISFVKKINVKKAKRIATAEIKTKIKKIKKDMVKNKSSISEWKELYATLSKSLDIAEFWIAGFGVKGLKRFIINGIIDVLESKTNEYLNDLTNGYIKVSWDGGEEKDSKNSADKLLLNISVGHRGKRDYLYCSEGEKARVWLATELALNEVKETSIDVVFVDEVFDGLDSHGVQKAIELITGENNKRRMICISHRDGVQKHFDNTMTVVMENDTSTLKAA